MDRTALDEFAKKLHQVPERENPNAPPNESPRYKPRDSSYYNSLAEDLPKVMEAAGFSPGKTELSPQEAARFLAEISNKLDDKNILKPDGTPANMSARQAFTIAFNNAKKADGNTDNPLKLDELAEQLKKEDFQRNLLSAQMGLAGRAPNPAQAVWTMDKVMALMMALATGDMANIQTTIQKAIQPAVGAPVAQFSDAQKAIDVEEPKLKALSALTGDVIEDAFKEIYGTLDSHGERSTKGPISQNSLKALEQRYKTEDGSVHPAVAFFRTQHEQGQSLEQVLERVVNNNEKLKAYIQEQGLSVEQQADMKASLIKAALGAEKGVQEWKGANGQFWTSSIDKKAAGEWMARDFGVKMNDPSLRFAVSRDAIKASFRQSINGIGQSQMPGSFAWDMAKAAGFEPGRLSKSAFLGSDHDAQGIGTIHTDGIAEPHKGFMQVVYDITREEMLRVNGWGQNNSLNSGLKPGVLPPELKQFENSTQNALLNHLVSQRVEKAIRDNPEWRAAVNRANPAPGGPVPAGATPPAAASPPAGGAAVPAQAVPQRAAASAIAIPQADPALFNDANFDRGAPVLASKVEMDPASHALKLSGANGNTALYLKTDRNLSLLEPVRGDGGIGFNSSAMSPDALKAALENHTKQGGTIEMRMVAMQDGDRRKADVVGVQLVLKDSTGKDVGNTMIGMGSEGGIEMEKSREQLQAMTRGINEPGADNRPKPGVTYAPGISSIPGASLGVPTTFH